MPNEMMSMSKETAMSNGRGGHLYMQTNEVKNFIVHYHRSANGTLDEVERVATGGAGSGTYKPISGQEIAPNAFEGAGSVILTPDRKFLFATNGADNSVSSFAVGEHGRLTLLDTLYRHGGRDAEGDALAPTPAQQPFISDLDTWLARHDALVFSGAARRGAAIHSLRAVDPDDVSRVVDATGDEPLHAHVSEQPAENRQVAAAFGRTPVAVLRDAGALGARFTAVHATHLAADDIANLSESFVCICPTTERDLGDGIGPARELHEAGARLTIGSDQHVVVDPFDELRALEGHERLRSSRRGIFSPAELITAATTDGYRSLGWTGGLAVGAVCDLVTLRTASPRTAGAALDQLWLAASAADVTDVVVGSQRVVTEGAHRLGDVGAALTTAIGAVLP